MKANLGCPRYCEGWLCVDIAPKDWRVAKAEASEWLREASDLDEIKTENLLEHIPDIHQFLSLCYQALRPGGSLEIVTDNAEWLPFYLPFDIPRTGIGAHSIPAYSKRFNAVHLAILTKMHLYQHLRLAGFKGIVVIRRQWRNLGARLEATAIK